MIQYKSIELMNVKEYRIKHFPMRTLPLDRFE